MDFFPRPSTREIYSTFHLTDTDSEEYKVVVPDDDPRFSAIRAIDGVLEESLREIEQFIEVYKRLEGDEKAEVHGCLSLDETHDLIRKHATCP